jgi:hypothetical protein
MAMFGKLPTNAIIPHMLTHFAETYSEGSYGSGAYNPDHTTAPTSPAPATPSESSSTKTQTTPVVEGPAPANNQVATPSATGTPQIENAATIQTTAQNTPQSTVFDMNLMVLIIAAIFIILIAAAIIIARKRRHG